MAALPQAFYSAFSPGPLGQRFCIWHADTARVPQALVVQVHAFAEEMNKSRRMAALQARALAAAGCAVLQFDLLGCGDSAGEFSEASWPAWVDDVLAAIALAHERFSQTWPSASAPTLWLWGHRAGALLAAQAASRLSEPVHLLLWQPTPNGKTVLQQFLRLETAGALLSNGKDKGNARALLARGEVAEVAGYGLAPTLTEGLEAARLQPPTQPGARARLEWLDVAALGGQQATPAAETAMKAWADAGWHVRHHSVAGPSFWQTTEIEEAPALISATTEALFSPPAQAAPRPAEQQAAA